MSASSVLAKVVTKPVEYKHGDVTLQGWLAYDDAVQERRPGVLVVHEWWGCNDFAKQKAEEVAGLGYVAFALDMYGKGVQADNPEAAGKLAGQFKGNPQLMRDRAKAGYDVLAKDDHVDPKRIAAIGFCFGGTTVLNMAYSGLNLAGVVSFHGGLVPPQDVDKNIQAKILVLHGADDPFVPAEAIKAFQEGVNKAKADWRMTYYSGAVHAFTNPSVDAHKMDGAKYDARTAKRSWEDMKRFLEEVFGK